jgi:hypothetical protein
VACVVIILTVAPGDAYNFVINVVSPSSKLTLHPLPNSSHKITYPLSVINALISFGLLYLYFFQPYPNTDWKSRITTPVKIASGFFGAANVFLFVMPLIKPPLGSEPYITLPYWTHAAGGWAVFGAGFLYWLVWIKLLPWKGAYELVKVEEIGGDGLARNVFQRQPR